MRKTVSVIVCLLMLCAVLVPFGASAAEPHNGDMNEVMATKVHVVMKDGTGTKNKEEEAAAYADAILKSGDSIGTKDGLKSGTMSFKDGVLTIENVSGVAKVEAFTGSLIINVVGKNEFSQTAGRACFVDDQFDPAGKKNADLTITSSTGGSLKITSKNYCLFTRTGNILIDGNVNLEVTALDVAAIQIGNVTKDGTIRIGGNANVTLHSPKMAIDVNRPTGLIRISDNANVRIDGNKNNYAIGIQCTADSAGEVVLIGNAKLTVDAGPTPVFSGKNGKLNVTLGMNAELTGSRLGENNVSFNLVAPSAAGTVSASAGDSAANAKKVSQLDPASAYAKITVTAALSTTASTTASAKTAAPAGTTAAKTADASVLVAAVAVAALSAAVVIRKKR